MYSGKSSLSLAEKFTESAKEVKNVKSITGVAMLIAMNVILSFASFNLSESLRISVSFIVTAVIGMMYGPAMCGLASGTGDLIRYLVKPVGGFFPGFTLTAVLEGVIFGVFLYKEKCTLTRAILAKSAVSLLLNCGLNTFWLTVMYGTPFTQLFITRSIKNIALLPVEILLMYVALKSMAKVFERVKPY